MTRPSSSACRACRMPNLSTVGGICADCRARIAALPTYRVFIEETATRRFYRDVQAPNKVAAAQLAQDAIDDATWPDWDASDTDAHLEVREDLTERRRTNT